MPTIHNQSTLPAIALEDTEHEQTEARLEILKLIHFVCDSPVQATDLEQAGNYIEGLLGVIKAAQEYLETEQRIEDRFSRHLHHAEDLLAIIKSQGDK